MDTIIQDLRYTVRTLMRQPGYAIAAIATLMLGIGANTAIFSIVNAVLLRPLPYRAPEQLVSIWGASATSNRALLSIRDLLDIQAQNQSFTEIGIERGQSINLTGGSAPDRLVGDFVSASMLHLLDARAALGRVFRPEETAIGQGAQVAVVSDALWRTRFGGDSTILGRTLILNGKPHVVIGVLAREFRDPMGDVDVWVPISSADTSWFSRGNQSVWGYGRMKPGITAAAAQRDVSTIAARIATDFPVTNAGLGASILPLNDLIVGQTRPMLLIILAAVIAVLLIACANVANLQLARAAARRREMSVRAALGAGRSRLLRQLLTESLLLSVLGGVAGVGLASLVLSSLTGAIPGGLPLSTPVTLDPRVLLFSIALTVVTGLVFGAAPAVHAARANLADSLRSRSADSTSGRKVDLRSVFVAVQLAVCVVLLIGAGLLTRSLFALQRVNPGFTAEHVLSAEFRLPAVKYRTPEQIQGFTEQLIVRLRAVPGVTSAALVQSVPLSGNWGYTNYAIPGKPEPAVGHAPETQLNVATDGFFRTLGIPLLSGRDFNAGDGATSAVVAIVNQEFVRRNFPGESAVGKQVRLLGPPEITATIVGVVGNVQQRTLSEPVTPQVYGVTAQNSNIFNSIVARTSGDPMAVANAMRAALWSIDPDQPVWKVRSLESLVSRDVAPSRFTMALTGGFALLALLLATVGVYGVMSYAATQRTREVGIRMALGARGEQVVGLLLGRGIRIIGVATVAGLLGSLALTGLIRGQLFGVQATDPLTLILVPILLAGIALLACWIPAHRASRVDPAITLRSE